MSDGIQINNATLVTGVTSTGSFILATVNKRQVGIPIYTFSYSDPEIDFVNPSADLNFKDETIVTQATSYGAGIAINLHNPTDPPSAWAGYTMYPGYTTSAFAVPMYRVVQNTETIPTITFDSPTVVSQMTYIGRYLAIKVNNQMYGIPLLNYTSLYPFTTSQPMSSIWVQTVIRLGKPVKDVGFDGPGSTNLNSKIKTYGQLINRIKFQLGFPFVNLEVCDDSQIVDFIDQAIEWYTKYAGYTEEFLIFNSELYREPGLRIDRLFTLTQTMRETMSNGLCASWDYELGDYRKVIGIFSFAQGETTGINTLFTLEQAMAQQTYFSYMLGNVGFDLVTWEVLKGWLDLREKVLAQVPYIDFDNRNQLLRIIPAPRMGQRYYGVVGCWVEKAIKDLIMERWVYQYATALTKIAIGNVRGKYQGVQLFGGGTINYNDLLTQGLQEKKQLEEEIMYHYGEVTPARFFLG